MFAYPSELMSELKKASGKSVYPRGPKLALPIDAHLSELLAVAYHASFLTEETRRIGFRLVYFPKYEWSHGSKFPGSQTPIPFRNVRSFSVGEVLRLAPAADYSQMLICVGPLRKSSVKEDPQLKIWGLVDAGSSWWEFIRGGSSGASCPPNRVTVSSTEPGSLTISWAGFLILRLRQGQIRKAARSVLHAGGPIGGFFADASKRIQKEVDAEYTSQREEKSDKDYPARSYLRFLQNVLFCIRDKAHGGTLIVVPDRLKHTDARLIDRVNIKYPVDDRRVWSLLKDLHVLHRKYYDLKKKIPAQKANSCTADFDEYVHIDYLQRENENEVADVARFVASLSSVDGAVVMTDRYRILGFGAEVLATSPSLDTVRVAGDEQGKKGTMTSIHSYGTRHRSAFRICSNYEDCLSFVVSQDGGIKAIRRVGPELVIWTDINMSRFVI